MSKIRETRRTLLASIAVALFGCASVAGCDLAPEEESPGAESTPADEPDGEEADPASEEEPGASKAPIPEELDEGESDESRRTGDGESEQDSSDSDETRDSSPEAEWASGIAERLAAQNRQRGPLWTHPAEAEDETLNVTIVETGAKAERTVSHGFADPAGFESCLELGYGTPYGEPEGPDADPSLEDPVAVEPDRCEAPDEMKPLLLAYRGAMNPGVVSCTDRCCQFADGPPVHEGLKVREICYETVDDGEGQPDFVATDTTIEKTGPKPDVRAEQQRLEALEFARQYGDADPESLREFFGEDSAVEVDLEITDARADGGSTQELTFEDPDSLVSCLAGEEACPVADEAADALAGPGHVAYLGIEPCRDDCCEVAGGHARHNSLFLEEVCFDSGASEPVVDGLDVRWQW